MHVVCISTISHEFLISYLQTKFFQSFFFSKLQCKISFCMEGRNSSASPDSKSSNIICRGQGSGLQWVAPCTRDTKPWSYVDHHLFGSYASRVCIKVYKLLEPCYILLFYLYTFHSKILDLFSYLVYWVGQMLRGSCFPCLCGCWDATIEGSRPPTRLEGGLDPSIVASQQHSCSVEVNAGLVCLIISQVSSW